MTITAVAIVARTAGCAVAMWGGWKLFGASGLVYAAPLIGVAFARPIVDLASAARHAMRRAQWRHVEGRHYAFRGRPIKVVDDADGRRWIRLADIRAVVGFTASEGALALAYPEGFRRIDRSGEAFLGEDAALAHLGKERGPDAIRLRLWVEREIVFPARRDRERRGAGARSADRDAAG